MSSSTELAPPESPPLTVAPAETVNSAPIGPVKRWTIAEFDELMIRGFIDEGSSTYLWDGEIIEPMPENPPHYHAIANLFRLLIVRLPDIAWTINIDIPLELAEGYKPQPDLLVVRGPREAYMSRVPRPPDVALLIEVSDTSYTKDSITVFRKYAATNVPLYWIVNIAERRIEVYSDPANPENGPPTHRSRTFYGLDERVPLELTNEGAATAFESILVRDVLKHSLVAQADDGVRQNGTDENPKETS